MREYTPNERIVDRAVELWKRVLKRPKFDNGDGSVNGFLSQSLASMANQALTDEQLEAFGVELKRLLMTPKEEGPYKWYRHSLHVDYHPDETLDTAAMAAGIREGSMTVFPWKTSMWLYEDHVSFGYGYASPSIGHYPLKNGKWLIVDLAGADITKVIEYVEGGQPTFNIED